MIALTLRNPNDSPDRWQYDIRFSTDGEHWSLFKVLDRVHVPLDTLGRFTDDMQSRAVDFYKSRPHLCDMADMPRVA